MSQHIQVILQNRNKKEKPKMTRIKMKIPSLLHQVTAKIAKNKKKSYKNRNQRKR